MLLQPFLQQCRIRPDATALTENDRRLSYGELLRQARNVAAGLQAGGVRTGRPVAIHLDRGIDATIAVFGALLGGACYVPLDLKNPSSRLAFIVEDAGVDAVLGIGQCPNDLDPKTWIDIADLPAAQPEVLEYTSGSLAAILYTSGSTGRPRGVALSRRAVSAFATWAADLLTLGPKDRIASSAPFFFDLSTFDLYGVLGSGAGLHFLPPMLTMAPARLSAWLKEKKISGWYTVPSLAAFLAYKGNLAETSLDNLRFLLFAGEVFPTPALIQLAAALPHTALFNFFGPTETNVCCYWPVACAQLKAEVPIPIGRPAVGCELRIQAETGELWVRGPTLADGYWSQGELQPFLNGEGWYATGDRVSLEGGQFQFHGRLGRMLKCSGYRVEPAEIEAMVNAIPGVKECAVVGVSDPTAGQRPALGLVIEPETTISDIRKALHPQLPTYMQPSKYQTFEALPRLANGKIDYRRLIEVFDVSS
ncbi:AMP-binding protein [Methylomonas sp. MgM2]